MIYLSQIIGLFLRSFWFLIPGGIANGTPPIVLKLFPNLNFPMDFGLEFRGKRIFGPHKTFRGLISGIITATLTSIFLAYLYKHGFNKYGLFDFSQNPVLYGVMSGAGALFGDAIKSFFKRQMNIPAGKSWLIFDQADWILGVLITFGLLTEITFPFAVASLITGMCLHLIFRFMGFILGIVKDII